MFVDKTWNVNLMSHDNPFSLDWSSACPGSFQIWWKLESLYIQLRPGTYGGFEPEEETEIRQRSLWHDESRFIMHMLCAFIYLFFCQLLKFSLIFDDYYFYWCLQFFVMLEKLVPNLYCKYVSYILHCVGTWIRYFAVRFLNVYKMSCINLFIYRLCFICNVRLILLHRFCVIF